MKKQFFKKMEKKLLEQREHIFIAASEATRNPNVDFDGDEADEVQANLLVYLTEHINFRYGQSLKKIEEALLRIKNNKYGMCEDCDDIISEKRLEFNPCFTVCVKCAEIREKEAKQMR